MERDIVMNNDLCRTIILDNYQNPSNRGVPNDKNYIKLNTNNESCIDNLDIYVKLKGNIIEDIKFEGEACVISISSTSIMTKLLIGKTKEEALDIIKNYKNMIEEEAYDASKLGEANAYFNICKQASRKKCATLSVNGIEKILKEDSL